METKFTKGNWHPMQYACYFTIQKDPFYDDGDDLLNAEKVGEIEAKANALLMSKSPKLLTTLNRSIDLLKKRTSVLGDYEEIIALIEYAEQLIIDATTLK